MKDRKFMDGLLWIVGMTLMTAVSWVLFGVIALVIKSLFCLGYGC